MSVELIEFGASWCAPCRALQPVLAALKSEGHNIRIVDTDKERALADQYRVSALPTLVFLKDGSEVHRIRGAVPKATILAALLAAEG